MGIVHSEAEESSALLDLVLQAFQAQRILRRSPGHPLAERLARSLEVLAQGPTVTAFWARVIPGGHRAEILARAGPAATYLDGLVLSDDPTEPPGQGPAGATLRSLSPVVARIEDPIFAPWRDRARAYGIRGSLSSAAAADDGTRYLLSLYRADLELLPRHAALVLDALAHAAAEAHQELTRLRRRELDRAYEQLVAWVRSTTSRAPEHTVLDLARHLAEIPGVAAVDALAVPEGEGRFHRLATYGQLRAAVLTLPEPKVHDTSASVPAATLAAGRPLVLRRPASHLELPDHWRADARLSSIPFVVGMPITFDGAIRALIMAFAAPGLEESERLALLLEQLNREANEAFEQAAALAERVGLADLFDALATGEDRLLACHSELELAEVATRTLVETHIFERAVLIHPEGILSEATRPGAAEPEDESLLVAEAVKQACATVCETGRPLTRRLATGPTSWDQSSAPQAWILATPVPEYDGLVLCAQAARSPIAGRRELLLLERMASAYAAQRARLALEGSLRAERDAQRASARRDPLTGLPNRLAFLEEAAVHCALVEEDRVGFALGILDLDGFKEWNDVFRHSEGDRILAAVGRSLAALPEEVFVARLGGDEFGLLARVAHGELAAVSEMVHAATAVPTPGGPLTGSLGWALYGPAGTDVETLLAHADEAMYRAKAQGGNRTRVFEEHMAEELGRRHRLRTQLARDLGTPSVQFWYQAQVDLAARRQSGVELLARWHDGHVLQRAAAFMDIVEHDPYLARRLDLAALEHACELAEASPALGRIAVNVAPRHLLGPHFPSDVARIITGRAAERIVLEITEAHSLGDDLEDAVRHLAAVRELGVRIAVDDFGKGWASLAYVHALPIDEIKLDRSLLDRVSMNPRSFAAALSALALGAYAGVEVVGEGIECVEDLAIWRAIGGRFVQGYLLGRPQPTPPTRLRPGIGAIVDATAALPLDDLPLIASLVAARAGAPFAHQRDDRCDLGAWLRWREESYGELEAFSALDAAHERVCGRTDESPALRAPLDALVRALIERRRTRAGLRTRTGRQDASRRPRTGAERARRRA